MSKPTSRKAGPASRKSPAGAASARSSPVADSSVTDGEALPDAEAVQGMLAPVRAFTTAPEQARTRGFLERLAETPPQVLLLEGGSADDRLAAAHYWLALLNCEARHPSLASLQEQSRSPVLPGLSPPPSPAQDSGATPGDERPTAPCLDCTACRGIITHLHRDCFFWDGTAGSIKIDEVRALRPVLGEPPREARFRAVLFREAQALGEAAANSLLKSFEEPRPNTSFILLAPQRERLLPTLVSRGMVLTLPWPLAEDAAGREALAPWEAALCTFLRGGRGLFELSGSKGALDAALAHALVNLCRRALVQSIKDRTLGAPPREGLESIFARLPEARMRMLDEALAECQESLIYSVNPALVIEWLATRMYLLLPRR